MSINKQLSTEKAQKTTRNPQDAENFACGDTKKMNASGIVAGATVGVLTPELPDASLYF